MRISSFLEFLSIACYNLTSLILLSSIMQRFIEDDFDEHQSTTIGVDFKTKIIPIDGVNVKLTIWYE